MPVESAPTSRNRLPSHLQAENNQIQKMGFTLSVEAAAYLWLAGFEEGRTRSDIIDELIRTHLGERYALAERAAREAEAD